MVMIRAEQHPIFTSFWRWYITNSVRGHSNSVRLRVEQLDAAPIATLWHGTHVSWWDGYLGVVLAQHFKLEYRVMMLEENLAKYKFLRYAGAFGINRGNARGALESIRYAVSELQLPAPHKPRGLLMFPSGEIGSPHQRPIPYESGVAALAVQAAKEKEIAVRALAIRLEHLTDAKPDVFMRLGPPRIVRAGIKTPHLTELMRDDLEREANALHDDLLRGQLERYDVIMAGSLNAQQGWDAFRRAIGLKV
jgi:1-acyl-sn-glycerol-3-phosphate acyltransferase